MGGMEHAQHPLPVHHPVFGRVLSRKQRDIVQHCWCAVVARAELPVSADLRKMIREVSISWLAGMIGLMAAEPSDLLRFTNGDQLHGSFLGMKAGPQAVWQRDDLTAPVDFKTSRLR